MIASEGDKKKKKKGSGYEKCAMCTVEDPPNKTELLENTTAVK